MFPAATCCLPTPTCKGKQGLTALWYVAPEWNVEWGGETMLYNRDQDAVACVTPRPGRLAIFDGTILHAGRPPNRICYAPRYTLAFKLEPPPT
jgi:Rps23 Pro-64 3,4-dihydroxylase Tpa1-like proline 4-hydroxylase